MESNDNNLTQKHFMLIGLKEAYDTNLVNKMEQGHPVIDHPYQKNYPDGKSDAVFHLRKSATTGDYFLNKFTMSAQKEGSGEVRTHTFYVDHKKNQEEGQKQKDNFTYKQAYNFLQGRPVYHSKSESWERIKPKEKLKNGNYASERFDKNYGYDVSKVIDQYSVVYKSSLKESLERGNLQKEKFLNKNGEHDELYASPAIRSGSLILYDLDKKPIPIEKQIQMGYINEEFGQKLIQRKQEQEQKEKIDRKETQKQSDKPGEGNKQTTKKSQQQEQGGRKPRKSQKQGAA